jgi:glycosyltransferase involved in cell wall biosynthesis
VQLALVLWNGALGGAEQFTASLAKEMKNAGIEPTIVFLGEHQPLSERLDDERIAYETLGFSRGSRVLLHERRFARVVAACGRTGAILDSSGYVAAALRAGGYRRRIVAVEHGGIVQERTASPARRVFTRLDRALCARAPDIEVAVSDFVLSALARKRHAREVVRIYNGVNLERFRAIARMGESRTLSIGWAGRMVPGKGVVELMQAAASLAREMPLRLFVAGSGPERQALEELSRRLELHGHTSFVGSTQDIPRFWAGCDVAAFPTNEWVESFGLAAVEAMACGRPVIASNSGGLAEVVADGRSGSLVEPGNVAALVAALRKYAHDASLRFAHGREGRRICEDRFDIRAIAKSYIALFEA